MKPTKTEETYTRDAAAYSEHLRTCETCKQVQVYDYRDVQKICAWGTTLWVNLQESKQSLDELLLRKKEKLEQEKNRHV